MFVVILKKLFLSMIYFINEKSPVIMNNKLLNVLLYIIKVKIR